MLPAAIAIHGGSANAATWIPLRQLLAGRVDVIASDLPGHGTRRGEAFDLDRAIAEIVDLVRRESARRTIVLTGDSLGGYIALAAAARSSAGVAGVVAGSCTYPMRGPEALLARLSLAGGLLVSDAFLAWLMRRVCAPNVSAAILERGLAPRMRNATLRALLGRDVSADIAAIAAPVVFVEGAFDVPAVWYAHRMARVADDGRAVVVPRAAHGVGLTNPEPFAQAIIDMTHAYEQG